MFSVGVKKSKKILPPIFNIDVLGFFTQIKTTFSSINSVNKRLKRRSWYLGQISPPLEDEKFD